MLKIIIPMLGSVLLSACFQTVKEDASANYQDAPNSYKKVTPNSSGVVIEDRNMTTQEHIARNRGGSFESQNVNTTVAGSATHSNAERLAIVDLRNSGAKFVLYFPYDAAEIDQAATQEIIRHANFMRDNPTLTLRLEGHADERGTREYNLALGENRALSIKEILGLYDLSSRVEVVSFGEEKPVATAHDESAWQQNRRVEFVYQ